MLVTIGMTVTIVMGLFGLALGIYGLCIALAECAAVIPTVVRQWKHDYVNYKFVKKLRGELMT